MPTPRAINDDPPGAISPQQVRLDVPVMLDLDQQRRVLGDEQQMFAVTNQLDPPVARDVVDDISPDVARQIVLGQLLQRRDDVVRVVTRRSGIPERERCDPVGVNMLRTLLSSANRASASRASS